MNVGFIVNDKKREWNLATAFIAGLGAHGATGRIISTGPAVDLSGLDAACMVGVKSRKYWQACEFEGVTPIMFDKGYSRHKIAGCWEYWRASIGAHQPTGYLMDIARPSDRVDRLDLILRPWRSEGSHVVIAGSSEKCHRFLNIEGPTEWARKIVSEVRRRCNKGIVYRPKPSWRGAESVTGAAYSIDGSLGGVLRGAHALVTHASNASFEAIVSGVPVVVTGDAVAKPVASDDISRLVTPDRGQWLANLAYCQWTLDEFRSGEAWETMKEQMAWT